MNTSKSDLEELVKAILDWWEEHQYDTTGDYGDFNMYNEEPEFVRKAKQIKEGGSIPD